MMCSDLKPCPFCGGPAGEILGRGDSAICCEDPSCLGYHHEQDEQGGWNHDLSAEAWNTRASYTQAEMEAARREAFNQAILVTKVMQHKLGSGAAELIRILEQHVDMHKPQEMNTRHT